MNSTAFPNQQLRTTQGNEKWLQHVNRTIFLISERKFQKMNIHLLQVTESMISLNSYLGFLIKQEVIVINLLGLKTLWLIGMIKKINVELE